MTTCSVIIINYNTAALTIQAARSVQQFSLKFSTELIIIDNASEEKDFLELKNGLRNLDPEIRLVRSRFNSGFGGGNMLGVQLASGDYYAFLNSDALLQEDSIAILIDFLESHPRVAIAGARAVDQNGKAYKAFDHRLSLTKELLGDQFLTLINSKKYPSRKNGLNKPTRVGAVPGSFFICRGKDFDQVGGFDTNLFLYYEEKDLAYRMEKDLNKTIYSLPQTTYIHLKGKSTPPSLLIKKELRISQFYSIRKNLGVLAYLVFYLWNLLKFALKAPLSSKNRKYFQLLLRGVSLAESLKHQQKITTLS